MTFTLSELTLLCRILKLQTLTGFELPMFLSTQQQQEAFDLLGVKNMIEHKKITPFGFTYLELIEKYANASRYVRIGSSVIACSQDKEYVSMTQKEEEYTLLPISQDQLVVVLLAKFTTWDQVKDGVLSEQSQAKESFASFMEQHKDTRALYYTSYKQEQQSNEVGVLYIDEPYFNKYNVRSEVLVQYPLDKVQTGIESIFQ